ncbi:MAG: beta-lactamase hydrolase domain-containing protein [Betaproteobacteria bacterium]
MTRSLILAAAVAVGLSAGPAGAQQVTRGEIPGIRNFARLETTVACGGAVKTDSVPEIEKMGFKAIFNLRLASEPGADIAGEEAAAKAVGLNYIHVPFTPRSPDPASVDKFLAAIKDPANDPAFIHCSGGNRAAGFWLIKRVLVDHWDTARAVKEAETLGLNDKGAMKRFALEYINSHKAL